MIELEPANALLERFPCASRHERRAMVEAIKLVQERAQELAEKSDFTGPAAAFRELDGFIDSLRTGLELRL